MISDGFGVASESMARTYMQQTRGLDAEWGSILDSTLRGTVRTKSSDSLVTDSAAGATVYSCGGIKTYNGAIGVDSRGQPCGTIMEAAKARGYVTGIVTTSRITHATPAAFAAHVEHRDMEDLIAMQMIGHNLTSDSRPAADLMYGGGLCHFLPQGSEHSCRDDSTDAWALAQRAGFTTISSLEQFRALQGAGGESTGARPLREGAPVLALFSGSHMAYEMDRNPREQPSLTEMTRTALRQLEQLANSTAGSPGFFVMIEGARIDHAGHDNDPAAHLHDIVEYWNAVAAVRDYVSAHPDTLMVATSDHETGGLALGIDPEYVWYPEVLKPVRRSAELICKDLKALDSDDDDNDSSVAADARSNILPKLLGIKHPTDAEVDRVVAAAAAKSAAECKMAIGGIVSRRAHIGWSTGGHTGTDVGLYACGHHASAVRGNMENTQVGRLLAEYLRVDTAPITQSLAGVGTKQPGAFARQATHHIHDHDYGRK
ncbi:vacuolar alkaline phosphatase [Coemansia javaensis]|uniref:Alkaline phosphatase n=1 Tax=Coemansia javaensis TaxID=2761396 RepID=A0A9W8H1Z9_9FUNG|nr:vacuolar alkaline phosphatase [Coemansia javaensis]